MRDVDIVVVSDVVCPWCLIGVTRLDQMLASRPEVRANVKFHPFLLDPTTLEEGEDLRERLERKYRIPAAQMFARVEAAAKESGIALDFEKVRRSVSTIRAHTLIRLGEASGQSGALKRALLRAYFLDGRDVGAIDTLVEIGLAHGLAETTVRERLADPAELAATRSIAREASEQGVTGVPFFVFDDKLAVSGAQSVEVLGQALDRALAMQSTDAARA